MIRRAAVGIAAALYALLSSPTPDVPGFPEYAIMALIVFAAVPVKCVRAAWTAPLAILLFYGFTMPLAIGALSGNAPSDIIRDLIAFCALGLPLVLGHLFPLDDAQAQKRLIYILLGIGIAFAARYILTNATPLGFADRDVLYLANSPLVAFAAAWCLLRGCFHARGGRAFGLVVLSIVPIIAMIGMMQRATIMLLVIAWAGFFLHALIQNPKRAAVLFIAVATIGILIWPLPVYVFESLENKTIAVGWNARGAEFAALFDALHHGPLNAMFGDGWGSLFKSPAVGDLWVRFSHALVTSLLWKTGWLGLILGVVAIGTLTLAAFRRLRHDMTAFAALILPLLPATFLYGSYKSLCFGLLLLGLAQLNGQNRLSGDSKTQ